ncbi:hypothetical protein GUJ93_ZPchr0010g10853 [Zizania palustris]|uniref:peptidylprolyl isomerase n=1 Tax=Zizania palustris TaxID=103762 RepID=A0A8J5WAT1_ZIZPA|nr:hypothetical protein GUJ93_ZPchr0010g10853 [Zizania palustris]
MNWSGGAESSQLQVLYSSFSLPAIYRLIPPYPPPPRQPPGSGSPSPIPRFVPPFLLLLLLLLLLYLAPWPRLSHPRAAAAAAAAAAAPPRAPGAPAGADPSPGARSPPRKGNHLAGKNVQFPLHYPGALLRYALPIDNKAVREVQKPLEDITDSLKIAGVRALDSVERNARQASRALSNGRSLILAGLAESKRANGEGLLDKLAVGLDELQRIVEDRKRDAVAPKQKELLQYVGTVEEDMVDGFPFEVPEEYSSMPLLKGRATVDMKVKIKDNPNLEDCVFRIVLDGYSAPVTAGNFLDLVERKFYDGMEIQRADGFVVQTGDPEGPAEGFIDPSTGKVRTVPLEIMVDGDKAPVYGETLEELGLYKAQTKLPFNAFGTMAMAREEFDDNSASSQVFWLLKESELTPSNANILDGRYTVFGYVTENEDYLADLKVGDVIESIQVVSGVDNLANPSYKIVG